MRVPNSARFVAAPGYPWSGCDRALAGWLCDAEAERLRGAVVKAAGKPARLATVKALHRRVAEMQP